MVHIFFLIKMREIKNTSNAKEEAQTHMMLQCTRSKEREDPPKINELHYNHTLSDVEYG